jgi:transposase
MSGPKSIRRAGSDVAPPGRCRMQMLLRYQLRRVNCPRGGVVVEMVPWAEASSGFTRDVEDHVAYLTQVIDRSTVSRNMRIAWPTVGAVVQRVMARRPDPGLLDGLEQHRHRRVLRQVPRSAPGPERSGRSAPGRGATAGGCGERGALKKTRWALLKSPWNLTALERQRLAQLQRTNRRLYRGISSKRHSPTSSGVARSNWFQRASWSGSAGPRALGFWSSRRSRLPSRSTSTRSSHPAGQIAGRRSTAR